MKCLQRNTCSVDKEEAQIRRHIQRFLDWDSVQVSWCAQKTLRPGLIAERTGMDTDDIYAMFKDIAHRYVILKKKKHD